MKDLTHYFADVEKSQNGQKIPNTIANGVKTCDNITQKRGRVKIKISQKNEDKICDIIESKYDLIDKTPSPYNSSRRNRRSAGTPKRSEKSRNSPKTSGKIAKKSRERLKNSGDLEESSNSSGSPGEHLEECGTQGNSGTSEDRLKNCGALEQLIADFGGGQKNSGEGQKNSGGFGEQQKNSGEGQKKSGGFGEQQKNSGDFGEHQKNSGEGQKNSGDFGEGQKNSGDALKNFGTCENDEFNMEIEEVDSDTEIFAPLKKIELENIEDSGGIEESKKSSNAFQLLMTRSKPVQYVPQKNLSPEHEAAEARKSQEVKIKMKQNKERLTALADRKGYSKRKLAEAEEAEVIEKRVEARTKVFKRPKREEEPGNQNVRNSGGLHNYFSKMTAEEREKEKLQALSKVVVKAEIHGSEDGKDPSRVTVRPRSLTRAAKNKARKVLAAIDDIQVLTESPSPPPVKSPIKVSVPVEAPVHISQPKLSKKPKWSLRINLSGTEDSLKDEPTEIAEIPEIIPRSKKRKAKDKAKRLSSRMENKSEKVEESKKSPEKISEKISEKSPEKTPDDLDDSIEIFEPSKRSQKSPRLRRSDSAPLSLKNPEKDPEELVHTNSEPLSSEILEIIEIKVQKLAPLFVKRQKPDPEVLAARKSFLHSKSPENGSKKIVRKNVGPSILPFPKISHISQNSQLEILESKNSEADFSKWQLRVPWIPNFNHDAAQFRNLNFHEVQKGKLGGREESGRKVDCEEVLGEIEERCPDVRELWSAISMIGGGGAHPEGADDKREKKRGRKRKSLEKNPPLLEAEKNLESVVWTQKYRPLQARQIVGNEDAATKLKTWLEAWQSPGKEDYSSGEEFYSSDNSYQNNLETNQVAVLLGPHGCGKTASVYAVAEELGYTVLELNASSRRPGKKILKDFEEATKSHRIKKADLGLQQKLATQVQKSEKIPQNSLILVEDVDLVFDEDDGFISAMSQLASNTKRPIVMTCRSSCAHLSRLAPQQMRIFYQPMSGPRAGALLEIITLAEAGTRLSQSCIEKLLAKGDLRKAVLQLQFLVLSGNAQASSVPQGFGETLWKDVKSSIYKPAIKGKSKRKMKKADSEIPMNVLEGLSEDLETISRFSNFVKIDDPILTVSEVKFEPSLSLLDNEEAYSSNVDQMMDISQWLRSRIMEKDGRDKSSSNQLFMVKKELNFGVNLALSQVAVNNLDNYSVRTDYLPTVRAICRAEEAKINSNMKRGNRFFHYLQSLRLPSASTKSNVLSAACKILKDDAAV